MDYLSSSFQVLKDHKLVSKISKYVFRMRFVALLQHTL